MILPNQIYNCKAEELLPQLDNESVDLIVTSPPYNLNDTNGGMTAKKGIWSPKNWYDVYEDKMPYADYVVWQRAILTECIRVLKPTGAIFYNHKYRVQNGLLQDNRDILEGFPIRQIIIWNRGGGINFNPGYFVPSFEVIYLIAKPDFILKPGVAGMGDVWSFAPDTNNRHPAPFPLELPLRCIGSTEAKLILDPFSGSGTTLLAAQKLGRNYLGCDISLEYCELARKRLALPFTPNMFETTPTEKPTQNVMFGE